MMNEVLDLGVEGHLRAVGHRGGGNVAHLSHQGVAGGDIADLSSLVLRHLSHRARQGDHECPLSLAQQLFPA